MVVFSFPGRKGRGAGFYRPAQRCELCLFSMATVESAVFPVNSCSEIVFDLILCASEDGMSLVVGSVAQCHQGWHFLTVIKDPNWWRNAKQKHQNFLLF